MSSIGNILKIATNTYHMGHPCAEEEIGTPESRYADWQGTGILVFAIATILSLGLAACVFVVTACLKSRNIVQQLTSEHLITDHIISNIEERCAAGNVTGVTIFIRFNREGSVFKTAVDPTNSIQEQVKTFLQISMPSPSENQNVDIDENDAVSVISCGTLFHRIDLDSKVDFYGFEFSKTSSNFERVRFREATLDRVCDSLKPFGIDTIENNGSLEPV